MSVPEIIGVGSTVMVTTLLFNTQGIPLRVLIIFRLNKVVTFRLLGSKVSDVALEISENVPEMVRLCH